MFNTEEGIFPRAGQKVEQGANLLSELSEVLEAVLSLHVLHLPEQDPKDSVTKTCHLL